VQRAIAAAAHAAQQTLASTTLALRTSALASSRAMLDATARQATAAAEGQRREREKAAAEAVTASIIAAAEAAQAEVGGRGIEAAAAAAGAAASHLRKLGGDGRVVGRALQPPLLLARRAIEAREIVAVPLPPAALIAEGTSLPSPRGALGGAGGVTAIVLPPRPQTPPAARALPPSDGDVALLHRLELEKFARTYAPAMLATLDAAWARFGSAPETLWVAVEKRYPGRAGP
jgi:hypothetical protein